MLLLTELRLENLRRFEQLQLELLPGWNVFVGTNGAGKTTILEGAYMLSHGHSFRAGGRAGVQRDGASGYSIFGQFTGTSGGEVRAGLARREGKLVARVDGETVAISELVRRCAVVCFEPGSHELIAGASDVRREFLDWGVFHVEHSFLPIWRRYQRALRQRNVLLRDGARDADFPPWDIELAAAGESLAAQRDAYLKLLREHIADYAARLLPELGVPEVRMLRGWEDGIDLFDLLSSNRQRDRERGYTTRGPHRCDWSLRFEHVSRREYYSRGQEKLAALTCLLAQARLHAKLRGHWPLFCFDDLASELDLEHQHAVVAVLGEDGVQALVTGTEAPTCLRGPSVGATMFHVEHGRVDRLI